MIITGSSQSVNVNISESDIAFRRAQLLGTADISVSGMIRPYSHELYDTCINKSSFTVDKNLNRQHFSKSFPVGQLSFLPLVVNQQYNSSYPFGWNDGSMIPARGYQLQVSTGVYWHYGPLHIQINPEIVWAQNSNFDTISTRSLNSKALSTYYGYYINYIDYPEQYGNGRYQKVFWGQSKVSLQWKAIEAAVSTENIWWGPGIRNSLIMSNNAPGFLHVSLNTIKPIKTGIGSFEFQLIGGLLKSSGIVPANVVSSPIYTPKRDNK